MKLIKIEDKPTQTIKPRVITLELTNDELNVIVAAFGVTSPDSRKRQFETYGLPIPSENTGVRLYDDLKKLSDFRY